MKLLSEEYARDINSQGVKKAIEALIESGGASSVIKANSTE